MSALTSKPMITIKPRIATKPMITIKPKIYANPTTRSNWVIEGKLLIGAYPDPQQPFIKQLLEAGVTMFVCLQTNDELSTFRDYRHLLPKNIKWQQFPITDRKVPKDADLLTFCSQLKELIAKGEVIYVHCKGGIGRSGLVAIMLLHMIQGLTRQEAITKANNQYQARAYLGQTKQKQIPQCKCQFEQLSRLLK